jgi:hypothetical protein
MIKLFGPLKNVSLLFFLLPCLGVNAQAQEESLGADVEEYENLEDAALTESPAAADPVESNSSAVAPTDEAASQPIEPKSEVAQDSSQEAAQAEESAEEAEEETVVAPASPASSEISAKVQTNEADQSSANSSRSATVGTYGGRIFGRHKIQLAANRPTFNEGQKCYEKFYGKPETHISFSGEWFPLDWWINPGLYTRLGVYSVRGKAVSGSSEATASSNCESLTVDENSSTSLLFMPIQVGAKIQFSPFRRKWLVVDYWTGAELDWWQETRNEVASILSPTALLAADQVYTTTGRKRSISAGASVHLLLNPLDERTVRSMIDTMGLGYVYLSGFMETVKSTSEDGLTFGRKVLGIGFTFEAYK